MSAAYEKIVDYMRGEKLASEIHAGIQFTSK